MDNHLSLNWDQSDPDKKIVLTSKWLPEQILTEFAWPGGYNGTINAKMLDQGFVLKGQCGVRYFNAEAEWKYDDQGKWAN